MRLCILVLLVGMIALGCASQPAQTDNRAADHEMESSQIPSVEEIANRAHVVYGQSLEQGRSKEDAVQEVVRFLKSQGSVGDAKVMGSDSVRVYFKDGNDLLLMLGKDRL